MKRNTMLVVAVLMFLSFLFGIVIMAVAMNNNVEESLNCLDTANDAVSYIDIDEENREGFAVVEIA